jgi:hypothetical protein
MLLVQNIPMNESINGTYVCPAPIDLSIKFIKQ